MRVTHEFEVHATCPADGTEDVYAATLTVGRFVAVEEILATIARCAMHPIYQEDLTARLATELGGAVTTTGTHSRVTTTVTVES